MDRPRIALSGSLRRDGGGFLLIGDDGVTYPLELGRTPVDLVAKRVRIAGSLEAGGRVIVDGVAPA